MRDVVGVGAGLVILEFGVGSIDQRLEVLCAGAGRHHCQGGSRQAAEH